MSSLLDELIAPLGQLRPEWAYAALAISAFLENVLPPVPGDTVVVFSAYLVGRGRLDWVPVYLATCLGGTAGFLVMFHIGRSRGRSFFQGRRNSVFSIDRLARVEAWLARYGIWLLLANRFLSGVRSVIALGAGIGGMAWRTAIVGSVLSMAIWNGGLLFAGSMVGRNWDRVAEILAQYNLVVTVVVLVLAAGLAARWWRRSRG